MIYVLLTYLFSPLLYLLIILRKKDAIERILVIQTAKIGDLVCSTPVFREVKKKYPNARLTALVSSVTKELLEYNPYVDEILTFNTADYKGLAGKVKLSQLVCRGRYDVLICLNPNIPFALAGLWGLVPQRISIMPNFSGFTFRFASALFTCLECHASGILISKTSVRALHCLGIESGDITKEVYKSPDAAAAVDRLVGQLEVPVIGFAVSSGNRLKELGADKIVEIVNALAKTLDVSVVLIGSHQDKEVARRVMQGVIKKERAIDTTGALNLRQLPALLEKLALYIGVDTGITYMADAVSVPILHLAGPIDTSEQRPVGKRVKVLQYHLPCVPCTYVFKVAHTCRKGDRACIARITTADVVNAAKELIDQGGAWE
jgi:ADP-heptose:LPS heptosyltransferase